MKRALFVVYTATVLALSLQAQATVYINRDYFWSDYEQQWHYNIVDRHYGSGHWTVDGSFGLQGTGSPYVMEADVYVDSGGTLTIDPGVTVQVPENHGIYVAGTLDAQGTAENHITITSTGGATPGSWDEILIYGAGANSTVLRYCDVTYGGSARYFSKFNGYHTSNGAIRVQDSAPTIDHCASSYANEGFEGVGACQATIANSTFSNCVYGIVLRDTSYYLPFGSPLPISGNTITGNTYGTYCSAQAAGAFDSDNTVSGNTYNVCQVYASWVQNAATWHHLQGNTVWQLIGDVYCGAGNSLTIDPGNIVKFNSVCSIFTWGTFTADGDPANKIYFTSINDDSVGGDSNADGSDTAPAKGDWSEVLFINDTSNASLMDNCVVEYGGSGRYADIATGYHNQYGNLGFFAASPTITNTLSSQSGNYGAYLRNNSHPVLNNVSFADLGSWAVYCDDIASNPVITACSATGSPRNAIRIPQATMSGSRTWYKSIPYVIEGSLWLAADANLIVEPGTAVKLSGGGLYLTGNVQAIGTPSEPIYFTSLQDDVYGDANGDGSASTPAPADWFEMEFYDATSSASVLDHCIVRYAGSGAYGSWNGYHYAYGNIFVRDGAPTFRNCTMEYSANYGIYGMSNCYAKIENCTIRNNVTGIVLEENAYYTPGTTPPISGCTFTGNTWGTWIAAQQLNEFAADNTFTANTSNTVRVYGSAVQSDATWRHLLGSPTISLHGNVLVGSDKTLTIDTGNVVKFNAGCSIYAAGKLTAIGDAAEKNYFTSWLDDTVGGDTNADGDATSPTPGSWNSIIFIGAGSSTSELKNCEVRYGSTDAYFSAPFIGYITHNGSVLIADSDPILEDVKIDSAGKYGLVVVNTSHPTLTRVDITNSGLYAAYQSMASNATITECTASSNGANGIYMQAGTVPENRTWYKSIPYVITGDTYVADTVQLKMNPGTVVKMNGNVGFYSYGDLQAVGDENDKIYFTSFQDDTTGGDTNADADATAPARGDWRELCIYGPTASPTHLKNCEVRYAGNEYYGNMGFGHHYAYGTVCLQNCAPTIEDCEISESAYAGFYCVDNAAANIVNCKIHDNTNHGMQIEDAYKSVADPLSIRSNDIYGNVNPIVGPPTPMLSVAGDNSIHDNTRNRIWVQGGTVNVDGTWRLISDGMCPFYIESYVIVPGSRTLTIEPGVSVKFGANTYMGIAGKIVAQGTDERRINFTSFKDDTLGGDSNGDGGDTAPAPGDYREIALWGEAAESTFSQCVFRYGGNDYYGSYNFGYHSADGNVYCYTISPVFDHCEFAFSGQNGVVCDSADATFNNCTLASNAGMGVYTFGDSDVTLNSTVISGNPYAATQCNPAEGGSLAANYCDLQGINYVNTLVWLDYYWAWQWRNTFPTGTGNFSANPLFVNPSAGDFTLQAASPCIHAGDPSKPGWNGNRLDIGAYPFKGLWNPMDIGQAKLAADGTDVLIAGKLVTAGTTELGDRIYIEDDNRVCAIKVMSGVTTTVGDRINVSGKLGVVDGERAIVDAALSVISSDSTVPEPFLFVNKTLGGATMGYNPGIPGAVGLNNLDMLVATFGKVTDTDTGCFWIDDGSGLAAEGGRMGVKVLSDESVAIGHIYRVRGISSVYSDGAKARSVVRTRNTADVVEVL